MKLNSYKRYPHRKGFSLPVKGVLLVVIIIPLVVFLARVFEVEKPQVSLLTAESLINSETEISLSLKDPKSGIQEVQITLEQNGRIVQLQNRKLARQNYVKAAGPKALSVDFSIDSKSLGISDGKANLHVVIRDFSLWGWLKGNVVHEIYPLVLDTVPPVVTLLESPANIKPGSVGIVVYKSAEPLEKHGVLLNGHFHQGFPLAARGVNTYGTIFSAPFYTMTIKESVVEVSDRAGNKTNTPFQVNLRSMRIIEDRIDISKNFLDRKLPEFSDYYQETTESMIDKYLYINREVRKHNNDYIRKICRQSSPEKIWQGKFNRMARSSRKASFADKRQYFYMGRIIDETVHLGIDLASVRHADVQAANRGEVVFADYLGIYGNMVILDHGIGVFSLYSHLSQILTDKGDVVSSGAVIGKTGTSGMAGGDHLHLGMLVNGIFVNPVEWWDSSWVNLNILQYLNDA